MFSPYGSKEGYDYKAVVQSVDIEAPVDSVFRYLGNSSRVGEWSVFVDGIILLNPNIVSDGLPGCKRRPYNKTKGLWWDETITKVIPDSLRQLTVENLHRFAMTANGLATEQRYTTLGPGRTRLTFTLFFIDKPRFYEQMKMYVGAYWVKDIYRRNLENIKSRVEGRKR